MVGWILLAAVGVVIGVGWWWSGRGLTDDARDELDRKFRNPGGWGEGM